MGNNFLLGEQYLQFMSMIQTATKGIGAVTEASGNAISFIADETGIVRVEAEMLECSETDPNEKHTMLEVVLYGLDQSRNGEKIRREFISRNVDELILTAYASENAVWTDNERKAVKFILANIATAFDRARMAELLQEAKYHDTMTGMLNTEGFIRYGNRIINMGMGESYSAFYFNLTNFKYVNKVATYQGGDKILILYTRRLRDLLSGDEVCGRLGGDNFVVMIKNEHVDSFLSFISSVEIAAEINGETHQFVFGANAGGMHLDKDTESMGSVMMSISAAYQMAKEVLHKPLVYCTQDMFQTLVQGKEVLMKFPAAIVDKEFVIFYQPKVDTTTEELVGAEALVRWRQGSVMVPPAGFIPILERNGDICALDYYVFETVCEHMKKWKEEGRKLPKVSSNFSRWHLNEADFVSRIIGIADEYEVDHEKLEIEVTETTSVNEYNTLLNVVKDFKKNGFSVSIDDFGTGYSSLNMLKEIPVDVLKLDKSMIDHSNNSENDKIMLKHIISLADDMSINVLAEGVETKEQRDYLMAIGCSMIQGYYYDRPLIIGEFEKRMEMGKYKK